MTLGKYLDPVKRLLEKFWPEETIGASKEKWNNLAKANSRFVIASRLGEGINEAQFKAMGAENYRDTVSSDQFLREKLGDFSSKEVLEIGCGTGRMTEYLARDFKTVTGIDIAEEMVAQGEKRLAHLPNVTLLATDGLHYPFSDNQFDFVFSFIVFQHMPNKETVRQNLKEVRRVLKSGQIAKIQIRGGHQPFRWQWFHGPAFKKTEAISMVQGLGFKVLKTSGEGSKLFWLWLTK